MIKQLDGKRYLGLPVLHPSRAVHWLPQDKSVPDVLEVSTEETLPWHRNRRLLSPKWGQPWAGKERTLRAAPAAQHGLCTAPGNEDSKLEAFK